MPPCKTHVSEVYRVGAAVEVECRLPSDDLGDGNYCARVVRRVDDQNVEVEFEGLLAADNVSPLREVHPTMWIRPQPPECPDGFPAPLHQGEKVDYYDDDTCRWMVARYAGVVPSSGKYRLLVSEDDSEKDVAQQKGLVPRDVRREHLRPA